MSDIAKIRNAWASFLAADLPQIRDVIGAQTWLTAPVDEHGSLAST
jgi:hypothetical protein